MEYSDLNEDICADSWLIQSNEISRRKLVRRTPRYNIYKADWFGDVLVYEPNSNYKQLENKESDLKQHELELTQPDGFNRSELSARLSELSLNSNLNLNLNSASFNNNCPLLRAGSQISLTSEGYASELTDSAYSSISSTPQYHTKSNIKSEFDFAGEPSEWPSMSRSSDLSDEKNNILAECKSERKQRKQCSLRPLVLNRSSYEMVGTTCNDCSINNQVKSQQQEASSAHQVEQRQSSWLNELNELRLVAHESFMLFMGFSIADQDTVFQTTSLVMQINHPKAASLYNLLHASDLEAVRSDSPLDRFFNNGNQPKQQLDLDAKLNICQQVTNAMTYLHDKNIVHGRLTSVNIYIEPNQGVKISLIDNDQQAIASIGTCCESKKQNLGSQCTSSSLFGFNLAAMTYLSPELIRTIKVIEEANTESGKLRGGGGVNKLYIDTSKLSKKSDIFSFGTLLFELFYEKFPFGELSSNKQSPHLPFPESRPFGFATNTLQTQNSKIKPSASELIYQIGSGQIGLKNLSDGCAQSALINDIISNCWQTNSADRPTFKRLTIDFDTY